MRARFLALWTVAVVATAAAFAVHLTVRFKTVHLGYDVGKARRTQRELIEARRNLALEAATLRQAARIEAVARGELAMDMPEPHQVVAVDGRRRSRAAGAVR
jgi:cell division protein FtsL